MIKICYKDTAYGTSVFHLAKAFFPNVEVSQQVDIEQEPLIRIELNEGTCFSICVKDIYSFGITNEPDKIRNFILRKTYDFLKGETNTTLPWGVLTGVRPTKLAMSSLNNMGRKLAIEKLCLDYLVSKEKAELAVDVAIKESDIISNLDLTDGFSLYVNIPFCPSICSYCSFGSTNINKWIDKADDYVKALSNEIKMLGELARGRFVNSIYIGGGTPTSLRVEQLNEILRAIDMSFSKDKLIEYTLEAGRADTITRDKLRLLKKYPITRISINPQTMQQDTLDRIGRSHKIGDVIDAFNMARDEGYNNINMDIIVGLPGETLVDVDKTLSYIKALSPDSLTVHSLAVKRASKYKEEKCHQKPHVHDDCCEDVKVADGEKLRSFDHMEDMLKLCYDYAKKMKMEPYYLYRQKNIAGNFENVGFAKVDKAGIYNILIMEELQTIFAAGAGGVTKLVVSEDEIVNGGSHRIKRFQNPKDIRFYLEEDLHYKENKYKEAIGNMGLT